LRRLASKKDITLRPPLVQRPTGLSIALAAASLGLFLLISSLAELPNERRLMTELLLISPILLYGLVSSGKGAR
jgi:hypothetical protein